MLKFKTIVPFKIWIACVTFLFFLFYPYLLCLPVCIQNAIAFKPLTYMPVQFGLGNTKVSNSVFNVSKTDTCTTIADSVTSSATSTALVEGTLGDGFIFFVWSDLERGGFLLLLLEDKYEGRFGNICGIDPSLNIGYNLSFLSTLPSDSTISLYRITSSDWKCNSQTKSCLEKTLSSRGIARLHFSNISRFYKVQM